MLYWGRSMLRGRHLQQRTSLWDKKLRELPGEQQLWRELLLRSVSSRQLYFFSALTFSPTQERAISLCLTPTQWSGGRWKELLIGSTLLMLRQPWCAALKTVVKWRGNVGGQSPAHPDVKTFAAKVTNKDQFLLCHLNHIAAFLLQWPDTTLSLTTLTKFSATPTCFPETLTFGNWTTFARHQRPTYHLTPMIKVKQASVGRGSAQIVETNVQQVEFHLSTSPIAKTQMSTTRKTFWWCKIVCAVSNQISGWTLSPRSPGRAGRKKMEGTTSRKPETNAVSSTKIKFKELMPWKL